MTENTYTKFPASNNEYQRIDLKAKSQFRTEDLHSNPLIESVNADYGEMK